MGVIWGKYKEYIALEACSLPSSHPQSAHTYKEQSNETRILSRVAFLGVPGLQLQFGEAAVHLEPRPGHAVVLSGLGFISRV